MKDLSKNKIDEVFRKGLSESDIPFDEAHWRDMKTRLANDNNRRRDIILWTSVGGAAAMLIMAFAWWFVTPPEVKEGKLVKGKPAQVLPESQPQAPATIEMHSGDLIKSEVSNNAQQNNSVVSGLRYTKNTPLSNDLIVQSDLEVQQPSPAGQQVASNIPENTDAPLPAVNNPELMPAQNQPVTAGAKQGQTIASNPINKVKDDSARIAVKSYARFKPELVLSIVASPDFAGVKTLSNLTSSFNGGILASVSLSKRLNVTTGALLAQKRYKTAFNNYTPNNGYIFSVAPKSVYAECRVLDIPLNLNYTFLQKANYKLGIVAGASSLLMLTEVYDFTYQNHYVKWPKNYKVRGDNKHFMSEANFALSYQRKLNNNIGVGLQPYVQVPLSGVGYGNVRLISAGASVSLNVNVSRITGKK